MLDGEVLVTTGTAPTTATVHEPVKPADAHVPKETIGCDVIVIGAGFSGITAIHRFRKLGLNVKCFESGSDFGGVWYWNRYPGARVDSELPFYQLNIPEVYRDWHFTQRFSDHNELRRYMAHIDSVLGLRKDAYFNARVCDARWDESAGQWTIRTLQGHTAKAKYLVSCTGLLHRTYTPDFPGLSSYKGEIYHSGAWPENFNPKGKKIGLIGAGATAVQITQELGKQASELTVFLRRPSYCLPMGQRAFTKEEQNSWKSFYPTLFTAGRNSMAGFPGSRQSQGVQDVSPEERERLFEELWARGAFNFQLSNYNNVILDPTANKIVYEFWRRKVCERLTDPAKHAIMAPPVEKQPYYFGTKRSPLEQDYYEVLNQPNVHLHSLTTSPLSTFTPTGLRMSDNKTYDFDAIVLATGFDSYSGSLTQLGLHNKHGVDLKQIWEQQGVNTYLGITIATFPNFFHAYTPQAPTALSNGPTIIEAQIETIASIISKLESEGAKRIEPQLEAEAEWTKVLGERSAMTLLPFTDSWWNGANIPGKKKENMIYVGGIDMYEQEVRGRFEEGWRGFDVTGGKRTEVTA
ncbi:hypothetical protein LTR62_008482 [Meristemomyces frigidus]|uniref:FAD/NAD(P)-binding domain-containing protein n=1 Tax=Meristemomyces frigidus TaxID=1508187 RepID=A0AAN7TPI9_9PEZI|nr:hypothetical protein LTR62_008482 [Meristemomyces frigidus]